MDYELAETPVDVARLYADNMFDLYQGRKLYDLLPQFDDQYTMARTRVSQRHLLRKEMPVISDSDLEKVKKFLAFHKADFCSSCIVEAGDIFPVQRQIYLDQSIKNMAMLGVDDTRASLSNMHIYISQDGYIIDGHHRWLEGFLMGCATPMLSFRAHLPFGPFLDMMHSFHKRERKVAND